MLLPVCKNNTSTRPTGNDAVRALVRTLGLMLLVCCLATACERSPEKKNSGSSVTPLNLFQRKQPTPPAPAVRKILLIGDSLSISLGGTLEHVLHGAPGIDFVWDGTRSTGLTRPDLLDWPRHLAELLQKRVPDVVVIMLGANDVMPVEGPHGAHVQFEDAAWPQAYAAKARELTRLCRQANPKVVIYWVGVPPMAEATLDTGVRRVNAALRAMCTADGCQFIDTRSAFVDAADHFTRHAKDTADGETSLIRTADGVHLTEHGAQLLTAQVLSVLAAAHTLPHWAAVDELLAKARDLHPIPDPPSAQPKTPAPPTRTFKRTTLHTIHAGETFVTLARALGVTPEDLVGLNPKVDPRHLAIGQKVRIPLEHKSRSQRRHGARR